MLHDGYNINYTNISDLPCKKEPGFTYQRTRSL